MLSIGKPFKLERDEAAAHRKAWDTRGRTGKPSAALDPRLVFGATGKKLDALIRSNPKGVAKILLQEWQSRTSGHIRQQIGALLPLTRKGQPLEFLRPSDGVTVWRGDSLGPSQQAASSWTTNPLAAATFGGRVVLETTVKPNEPAIDLRKAAKHLKFKVRFGGEDEIILFHERGTAITKKAFQDRIYRHASVAHLVRDEAEAHKKAWDTRGRKEQEQRAVEPPPPLPLEERRIAQEMERHQTRENLKRAAVEFGFPVERLRLVDEEPRSFTVGKQQFNEAGHYSTKTREIVLNVHNIPSRSAKALLAHEIMHAMYHTVSEQQEREHDEIRELPPSTRNRLFDKDGFARPEHLQELYKDYPASAAFAKTWGDAFLSTRAERAADASGWQTARRHEMIQADGQSSYSRAYWAQPALGGGDWTESAVNETLAEVARAKVAGKSAKVSPIWQQFADDIEHAYRTLQQPRGWHKIG